MIGGHRWQKSHGKKSSCHESARFASKSLTVPVPKEHHSVKYTGYSRVADIILQIGWETNKVVVWGWGIQWGLGPTNFVAR